MKVLSRGLEIIQETGKYTCATVEYTGLFSYSLLRRGGQVISDSFWRVGTPAAQGLAWPFTEMANMTFRRWGRRAYLDEKFKSVEDKLVQIAEKLTAMEKRGAVFRETGVPKATPRLVDLDKQAFLRQIVEANKALLDALEAE